MPYALGGFLIDAAEVKSEAPPESKKMQTSTDEAFLLLEGWRSNSTPLRIISVLQEGRVIGQQFDGFLLAAIKNSGVVEFLVTLPDGSSDTERFDLADASFDYFEPGRDVVVQGGDWLCFLKVSLFPGGMILIGVPR